VKFKKELFDTSFEIDLCQIPRLESHILNPKLIKIKCRSIGTALINMQLFRRLT